MNGRTESTLVTKAKARTKVADNGHQAELDLEDPMTYARNGGLVISIEELSANATHRREHSRQKWQYARPDFNDLWLKGKTRDTSASRPQAFDEGVVFETDTPVDQLEAVFNGLPGLRPQPKKTMIATEPWPERKPRPQPEPLPERLTDQAGRLTPAVFEAIRPQPILKPGEKKENLTPRQLEERRPPRYSHVKKILFLHRGKGLEPIRVGITKLNQATQNGRKTYWLGHEPKNRADWAEGKMDRKVHLARAGVPCRHTRHDTTVIHLEDGLDLEVPCCACGKILFIGDRKVAAEEIIYRKARGKLGKLIIRSYKTGKIRKPKPQIEE